MLVAKTASLPDRIITLLAKKPNLTVKEIWQEVKTKKYNYTLRAIYKELTRLEEQEVVLKIKKVYSLRIGWIVELLFFSQGAYENYSTKEQLDYLLPTNLGRVKIHFTSVRRLDIIWIQTMLLLSRLNPKSSIFLWIPYQFFHLLHDRTLKQFFVTEERLGNKRYHIIGLDCYLAREGAKHIHKNSKVVFDPNFVTDSIEYYSLIGEHLITVKLSKTFNSSISNLFDTIKNANGLNEHKEKILKLLSSQVNCSLTIEHKTSKFRKIDASFREYFKIDG
jgi:hypothetical protein